MDYLLKTKKDYKNLKKQDIHNIYLNRLDKACFQHGMAYGDFKDLPRRTASVKVLCDKAFNITKNPKYDGYQKGLASIVYKYFAKKSSSSNTSAMCANRFGGDGMKNENMPEQQSAEELHKPIIRKFEKWKVHSSFIDNILGCWSSRYAINK